MDKKYISGGVIGLVGGLAIGFFGANFLNRSSENGLNAANSAAPMSQSAPMAGSMPSMPNSGQNQGAMVAEVQKVIERAKNEPDNYDAQIEAGEMYSKIQRFDEGLKYYENAQKLKPEDVDANTKLGNAYFDAQKYPEAANYYAKVLEQDPKNVSVRTDYGLTFYLRQPSNIDAAIAEYKKSLAIDPKHELTLQNLAVAYSDKKDKAGYDETIAKLREANPNNPVLDKLQSP
ncbi:MAG: tetratricopeptide repeat protein [Pyrinomonadaceae bacterium]